MSVRRSSRSHLSGAARVLARGVLRTPGLDVADLLEPVGAASPRRVRATFLGVSTVLLDDGETALLTDGFFTRPNVLRSVVSRVGPDERRIRAGLVLGGVDRLAAVLVAHSHYDHALDSAAVARLTGATVLGSASTRLVALGGGLPDDRIRVLTPGEPLAFGAFTITALPARHSPGDIAPGEVEHLLHPPAKVRDYRTGGCFSFHVAHPDGQLLVHASANAEPGALAGHRAYTAYLGIGVLGRQTEAFRDTYWRETVAAVGARRVVPIHWDNFTRGLHRPLRPLPRPFDDVPAALAWLRRRCADQGVDLAWPRTGNPVDPWRRPVAR